MSVDAFIPTINVVRQFYLDTAANPEDIATAWIGRVNQTPWRGGAAGQWLVTSVEFELVKDVQPTVGSKDVADRSTYLFTFTFESKKGMPNDKWGAWGEWTDTSGDGLNQPDESARKYFDNIYPELNFQAGAGFGVQFPA